MKRITKQLRIARATADLSQLDVSIKTNMSYRRYWEIENGYRKPTAAEMKRIVKALKTSEAQLFHEPAVELVPVEGR